MISTVTPAEFAPRGDVVVPFPKVGSGFPVVFSSRKTGLKSPAFPPFRKSHLHIRTRPFSCQRCARPRGLDSGFRGAARARRRLKRKGSRSMREFELGRAVPRTEDVPLLRGRGRYTDAIVLPRQSHLHVLRSPHAAARIRGIDTAAAVAAPGVLAVLTGADAASEGLGTFASRVQRRRANGSANFVPPYRVLAPEPGHHVGEPLAAGLPPRLPAAHSAAQLLDIAREILPSGTGTPAPAPPRA